MKGLKSFYLCKIVHSNNSAFTFIEGIVKESEETRKWPCCNVALTSIDRLFAQSERRFDIVKFSVQGYDIKAIRGATNLFTNFPPKIIVFDYNYGFLQSELAPERFIEELFSQWQYNSIIVEGTEFDLKW
jgi:hypothetical protein